MSQVTRLSLDPNRRVERRRINLTEISDDTDDPLAWVGSDLRAARLRRGDDLATLSTKLRIRRDYLEAIEEGNIEALPGRAYALGFVRAYAEHVGIEGEEAVRRFKAEISGRETPDAKLDFPDPVEEARLPQGSFVILALLLVAAIYGGWYLTNTAEQLVAERVPEPPSEPVMGQMPPPAQPLIPPPAAQPIVAAPGVPADAAPAALPDTVPSGASGTAPGETAETGTPGVAEAAAAPDPGSITEDLAAPEDPGAPPAGEPAPPEASPAETVLAALPAGRTMGLQNRVSRITVRTAERVRVVVRSDDGTTFLNRTLREGDSYQAPDLVGLTLSATDGSLVYLVLDGMAFGPIGAPGEPVDLPLDPQSVFDRFAAGN